jgi:hypothetical protein
MVAPETTKKKPQQTEERIKVVLYLTGDERDKQGLAAGKRMVDGLRGELILAFVIVVPRELPLQAPMQELEDLAVKAFAEADSYLKPTDVPHVAVLERGRDVASALESVIEEREGNYLLIPLAPDPGRVEEELKLVKQALSKVSTPVAFIRGGLQQAGSSG